MTDTHKKNLLKIGKSVNPRYFKYIKITNLPISYLANKNAWMTAGILRFS